MISNHDGKLEKANNEEERKFSEKLPSSGVNSDKDQNMVNKTTSDSRNNTGIDVISNLPPTTDQKEKKRKNSKDSLQEESIKSKQMTSQAESPGGKKKTQKDVVEKNHNLRPRKRRK